MQMYIGVSSTWCRSLKLFRYCDKPDCLEEGATVQNSSKLAVFGTKNSTKSGILLLTIM